MALHNIAYILIAVMILLGSQLLIKYRPVRLFCTKTLLIILILELVVFNFNSYHLISGKYRQISLDFSDASISGFTKNKDGSLAVSNGSEGSIEFKNIEIPVGTIFFDSELSDNTARCSVSVDMSDETNTEYRVDIARGELINHFTRSKTIVCQFSGKVKNLRIHLKASDGSEVTLKGLTLNKPVEFYFSIIRLLAIFLTALAVYSLIHFPSMKSSCKEEPKRLQQISAIMTVAFVAVAVFMTVCYSAGNTEGRIFDFKSTTGDQLTKELVDAFKNGQVSLLEKPSEELLNLDNPYDWSQRLSHGVSYLWDHCFYNGKYYSYYGIAPVLLLFLPYNLITGYYFPTPLAVLIFGSTGIVFLTLLYLEFIKKFFPNLPLKIIIPGLAILQFSNGIWFCFASPLFYEIASSSGFAFVTSGSYFILRSNVIGGGRISKWKLSMATVLLSISVLCRPTLAVYCLAALAFLWFGFKKQRNELSELSETNQNQRLSYFKYFASGFIPFIIFGGLQMLYNYARFQSFFDFGIKYSLTINDFIHSQYHTHFAMIGFYNYLIAFPQVTTEFPFIHSSFQDLNVNGYYFAANTIAIGIFFRALPMFAYSLAGKAYQRLDRKKRKMALILIGLTCVAAPLVIIFSIWESGYGIRYSIDFSWQLLIGAYAIAFFLYQKETNSPLKKIAEKLFVYCGLLAFIVNFALVYSFFANELTSDIIKASFFKFERLFEFWR